MNKILLAVCKYLHDFLHSTRVRSSTFATFVLPLQRSEERINADYEEDCIHRLVSLVLRQLPHTVISSREIKKFVHMCLFLNVQVT